MNKSISRQMAEFAVSLKFADLPEKVVNEVKRYMYDSIGCAYGGYHTNDLNIIEIQCSYHKRINKSCIYSWKFIAKSQNGGVTFSAYINVNIPNDI